MRKVTKCKLFTLLPLILIAIFLFIASIIVPSRPIYYFLTFWTFWGNLLYLLITHFCDWALFIFQTQRFEHICSFMRNHYCRISFTFSYAVALLYWNLFFLGDNFLYAKIALLPCISHFYFHGGITVTLLLDLFLFEHKTLQWNKIELIIIISIMCVYAIVAGYAKYMKNFICYRFMTNATPSQLSVSFIVFMVVVLNSYQLHMFLVKVKNKLIVNKESANTHKGVVTVELADLPEPSTEI